MKTAKIANGYVIVRTFSAGVHVGELVSRVGREVELTAARRIWSWTQARTLHEIALAGVGPGSRVSAPVGRIILTEAVEIIDASSDARASLEAVVWE